MEFTRVRVPITTSGPGNATNAYLIDGEEPLLIDPASATDQLETVVRDGGVAHIAVTHTHPDHVGGVAHFADRYDATVWAFRPTQDRFVNATGVYPDRVFGETSSVGPVSVMASPGHAPDHVVFYDQETAFVGDLAFADSSVFVGGDDGDMRAYLGSLRRLLMRDFDVLHPGHGATIADPQETLTRLITHRLDREARVLRAVRGGASTLDDIVDVAYANEDLAGVRRLARLAVAAHLEKLVVEDAVVWDGTTAQPA